MFFSFQYVILFCECSLYTQNREAITKIKNSIFPFFSEAESSQDRIPTYINQDYLVPYKSTPQPNYPIPIRTSPSKGFSPTSPKSVRGQQQGYVRKGEQNSEVSIRTRSCRVLIQVEYGFMEGYYWAKVMIFIFLFLRRICFLYYTYSFHIIGTKKKITML